MDSVFWCTNAFKFDGVQFVGFFPVVACARGVTPKKSLLKSVSCFHLCFLLRVLYSFRSLVHFDLMFVYDGRLESNLIFFPCGYAVFSSTLYWKNYTTSPLNDIGALLKRIWRYMRESSPGLSILFRCSVCLSFCRSAYHSSVVKCESSSFVLLFREANETPTSKNGHRIWMDVSPKKMYKWPISPWKKILTSLIIREI